MKPHLQKHAFKKGQSGNPQGGRAHNAEEKALKKLTKEELIEIGNIIVKGDMDQLKAIAKDPKASVIQVMIASVAAKTIAKGDMHALDILLNRLVGKVKDEIDLTGTFKPAPVTIDITQFRQLQSDFDNEY